MSDEIFISEKTGKRYKFIGECPYGVKGNCLPVEIIEPKLEVGDWFLRSKEYELIGIEVDRCLSDAPSNLDYIRTIAVEIRKANGEIWVKENNEWRQKK